MYAVKDILYPAADSGIGPVPKLEASRPYVADGSKINIVALGDSLTEGVGDISTKGYVKQVQEKLTARNGKPVYVLNNFAVSGYRTDQLLNDLTQKKADRPSPRGSGFDYADDWGQRYF